MLRIVHDLFKSIIDLVYPAQCAYCNKQIASYNIYCITCASICPMTDHFEVLRNGIYNRLHTRISITKGFSLFYYVKDGMVQKAIHKIKYTGRKDLARKFGREFGCKYFELKAVDRVDFIIPIPIHSKRRKQRGYNQSEEFAEGIRRETNIKILKSVLLKRLNQKSLTRQSRESRFSQVKRSFVLRNKELLMNKRILLVDDVLTTGATIEAAVEILQTAQCKTIQVGVIALALN